MGLLNFLLPTDPARDYEEDPGGTVAALAAFERRNGRIATSRDRLVRDGDEYVKAPLSEEVVVRRRWFRDRDGTYYRNVPMVLDELSTTWSVRLWKRAMLLSELDHIYREGHTRRRTLGWWQVEVQPMPMRLAYPDRPVFWTLDEDR